MDNLIDRYELRLVVYMQEKYDKDAVPCDEYFQMMRYLGLTPEEYHDDYDECRWRAEDLLFRYEDELRNYTGYQGDQED